MAIDSIAGLLAAVDRLPGRSRADAVARIDAAVALPAPDARLRLAELALELAAAPAAPVAPPVATDPIILPELAAVSRGR